VLKQQCSSKCSDCAVAGIVEHGTREGVHTAGGDQSPLPQTDQGTDRTWTVAIAAFSTRAFILASEQASKL